MNRSRARVLVVSLMIAFICGITGDMFQSKSIVGNAIANTLPDPRSARVGAKPSTPKVIRAKSGLAGPVGPHIDSGVWANVQAPPSIDPSLIDHVSLVSPAPFAGELMDAIPTGEAGPANGGDGPVGGPFGFEQP